MPIPTIQQPLNLSGIYSHVRSWVIPSPSLVPKRAMSPAKVKPLKLMVSARNTRTYAIKVVSPPESPHSFPDESAVQWKASTILLEQPHVKRAPEHQQLRGCRLLHEFPLQTDEDPSLRARGRKTSRAVAWCSQYLAFSYLSVHFLSSHRRFPSISPLLGLDQDDIFQLSHSKRQLLLTIHVDVFLALCFVFHPSTFFAHPSSRRIWIPNSNGLWCHYKNDSSHIPLSFIFFTPSYHT